MVHPCQRCGACCASFRVAFDWSEAQPANAGGLPEAFVEPLRRHELALRHDPAMPMRCVALAGVVGEHVHCTVYARRPSPCRDLGAAWEHGQPSPQCDRARAKHGLPALTPADWR